MHQMDKLIYLYIHSRSICCYTQ